MSNNTLRTLLLVFMILYIVSPLDACPGPIDDIILAVMGVAARKKLNNDY